MLFGNRRVEEELERIRKANLPPPSDSESLSSLEAGDSDESVGSVESADSAGFVEEKFSAKDILAMIIAAFSILIPYALIFIGVAVLFVLLFFR